jgi:hypothetical protein
MSNSRDGVRAVNAAAVQGWTRDASIDRGKLADVALMQDEWRAARLWQAKA